VRPLQLLLLLAITSGLAVVVGLAVLKLPRPALRRGAFVALETFGFGVAFFLLNVSVTVGAAIVLRRISGFVSLYSSNDLVLLLCSLLQGLVFASWRRAAGRAGEP
jgi:hypothetical protein